jgi:hypothetical protein
MKLNLEELNTPKLKNKINIQKFLELNSDRVIRRVNGSKNYLINKFITNSNVNNYYNQECNYEDILKDKENIIKTLRNENEKLKLEIKSMNNNLLFEKNKNKILFDKINRTSRGLNESARKTLKTMKPQFIEYSTEKKIVKTQESSIDKYKGDYLDQKFNAKSKS